MCQALPPASKNPSPLLSSLSILSPFCFVITSPSPTLFAFLLCSGMTAEPLGAGVAKTTTLCPISSGCLTEFHRLRGFNNRTLFFLHSRGWKSKIKALTGLVPGLQMAVFSWCPHMAFSIMYMHPWCLFFIL